MKVRVFTLRLDPTTGTFDDGELEAFCDTHRVLSLTESFFIFDGTPTLALVVRYQPTATRAVPGRAPSPRPSTKTAPPLELADADRGLYESLRKWRNARAKRDGRPAFVLFSNAQLAAIATLRPATLTALKAIDGIGDGRLSQYGEELLALIPAIPPGAEVSPDAGP